MEILELFSVDWKLIIAQLVNFAIVVIVLWLFAIKPLTKVMAKRNDEISKGLADAKQSAEQLRNAETEFKNRLKEAHKEADVILQVAKQQTEKNQHVSLEKTRHEVKKIIDESKQRLNSEKELMLSETKQEIIEMVTLALQKMLADNLENSTDKKYIEGILDKIHERK